MKSKRSRRRKLKAKEKICKRKECHNIMGKVMDAIGKKNGKKRWREKWPNSLMIDCKVTFPV